MVLLMAVYTLGISHDVIGSNVGMQLHELSGLSHPSSRKLCKLFIVMTFP